MKTPDLIKSLAAELETRPGRLPWAAAVLLKWLAGTALLSALALAILPSRADMAARAADPRFLAESLLWLLACLAAADLSYRSSLPGQWRSDRRIRAFLPLAALTALLLFRLSIRGFETELIGEMDIYRGWCGPLIFVIGGLQAALLFTLARTAAPTRLKLTGGWIAVSAGCLGGLLMQFICAHDNSLHIVLWHFVPVIALALLGASLGKNLLRW